MSCRIRNWKSEHLFHRNMEKLASVAVKRTFRAGNTAWSCQGRRSQVFAALTAYILNGCNRNARKPCLHLIDISF